MKNVRTILRAKTIQLVHSVEPNATMFDALKVMAQENIGALLVIEHGKTVGIVTERDYARKIVLTGRTSRDTAVRDVMTSPVMVVGPDQTTEECMALMTKHRLRHLPVFDEGALIGLISIGDLVADIISEQKFMIEQLQLYIAGEPAIGRAMASPVAAPTS
jgi:CBS domain-containing protein